MKPATPLTDAEKEATYGCAYCCAVGACPRCWGRAGIDKLQAERDKLLETNKRLVEALKACYDRKPLACTEAGVLLRSLGEVE